MPKKTKTPKVVIAWMNNPDSDEINFLSYGGSRGPLRVYDKDNVDSRCLLNDSNPPYFSRGAEAVAYMVQNPGLKGVIQMDTRLARALGVSVDDS